MSDLRWLKSYPALLSAYWALALEYRNRTLIWILSGALPLFMLLIWLTIAEEQEGSINGYDSQDFISYYIIMILIRRMVGVWVIWDLDRDVRLGELSAKLLKPIDPAHFHVARMLSLRPLQLFLIGPPIFLASWIFNAQYNLAPLNLLFLLLAITGAFLIELFAQFLIGTFSFWITHAVSIATVWFYLRSLLSGWIVPLDLFPPAFLTPLHYLSFRYQLSFPVEIILGNLSVAEIGEGLLIQYSWVLFFFVIYRISWHYGIKRYGAVGA